MSEVSVELEIKNLKGLHARAAAAFVKSIEGLDADIFVEKDGQEVDGSSIFRSAASKGSHIKVKASGSDAEQAIENITKLVNSLFGEEL